MKPALKAAIAQAILPPYKSFNYVEDEDLLEPGVKIRWKDDAFDCVRDAVVVERGKEFAFWVDEGRGNILINICHIVAIEEGRPKFRTYQLETQTDMQPLIEGRTPSTWLVDNADLISEEDFYNTSLTENDLKAKYKPVEVKEGTTMGSNRREGAKVEAPAKQAITADVVIAAYIKTRDAIESEKKIYEEKVEKMKAVQGKREQWLTSELDKLKLTSFKKTGVGIAFFKNRTSATIADATQFVDWVKEDWEGRNHFLEKRVSKTAVDESVKDGHTPPPGTSYSTTRVVQINRG